MKSFALLRTNTGLTTNIKIMIDSNYKLSLDSIDSDPNLSFDKFKKVQFTKDNYYDELIPYFYKTLPADTAFSIKYENDVESMSDDFKNQYDELYSYGARNIIDNKNYTEEYEYFAPLYITKNGLPKKFIIFRVDGSGIGTTTKDNFKFEIIKKLKTIKIFELTKETSIGEWLGRNFTDNKYFPDSPLDIDFRNLEFCRWNGIDYTNGGYTYKSLFIDDILDEEKEIFELEKFVFDSYKNNKVVFPNILNFSFLFDDTPSTPDIKRKWSINRYYGFYLEDLEVVKTISPYLPIALQNDIEVTEGNILSSSSSSNPFVQDWVETKPFYVEYNGNYYKVEKFTETITNQLIKVNNLLSTTKSRNTKDLGFRSSKPNSNESNDIKKYVTTNTKSAVEEFGEIIVDRYRIISDLDLSGLTASSLNQNFGQIELNTNRIVDFNNNDIQIEGFDNQDNNIGVWLIEINGIYHNLIKNNNSYLLNTDYSFNFGQGTSSSVNEFTYKVAGNLTRVSTLVDFNNRPKKFTIYKVKFSDIKDFDNRIVDTEFSKYEYEESESITNTDETKMYLENLLSMSSPIDLDDFIYKDKVVNIPVSSEYTANYETFKIDTDLSEIWRKNPVYCRWGFQKSLSANDVPYLLNNSLIFEDYNRTSNNYEDYPKRMERNLDYFYSINSASSSYTHHSLHVQQLDSNKNIDTSFKFELDKYLGFATYSGGTYSFDYFTYFFSKKTEFFNGKIQKNTNKFSYFNVGDLSVPNHTLFRGIRFDAYEVNSITLDNNNKLDRLNIKSSNYFDDYKFSILLSKNNDELIFNNTLNTNKVTGITNSIVPSDWEIIQEWKMNNKYQIGDIIKYDDILYQCEILKDKYTAEHPLLQGFIFYDNATIFWNPDNSYNINSFIYNSNEYYHFVTQSTIDFWNPEKALTIGYSDGDVVLYRNKYYQSITFSNSLTPSNNSQSWTTSSTTQSKWELINIWESNKSYKKGEYKIYNNILYKYNDSNQFVVLNTSSDSIVGQSPELDKVWREKYSMVPSDRIYSVGIDNNSVIFMNNRYYMRKVKQPAKLNNGIIIYINKKWKNILININIPDNTYPNLSDANRDSLYNELYKKLTAANFINAVNDITNKYDFINYISYIVIDETGNDIRKFSSSLNNLKDLPYYIKCEEPDKLDIKVDSLFKRGVSLPNTLNPFKKLDNGKITNITQLNYYNNIPVAANIIENKFQPKVFENYHGNKNITAHEIFRYSGYYMPIFYNVSLFEVDEYNLGNYKFDTNLTDFGIMKERKVRKINRKGNILRLGNVNDEKSMYPMLDEFGYSVYDFFIFSSTWDLKYYLETVSISNSKDYLQKYGKDENLINSFENISIPITIPNDIGQK